MLYILGSTVKKVISSYVRSLFDFSMERDEFVSIKKSIEDLLRSEHKALDIFYTALSSPIFSKDDKYKVIDSLVDNLYLRNFLKVVTCNNKAKLLPLIFDRFITLVKDYHGQIDTEIKSTILLQKQQINELHTVLGNLLGKKPVIDNILDKSILGGLVIKTNSLMIDMSYLARLERLKNWSIDTINHSSI
jgi:F-type H+-transporting ATPase subunit delta